MTSPKECKNEEDLYSDLPNFQYEDSVRKLEQVNKKLLEDKQKLQKRVLELEELVEEIQKNKSKVEKKNNHLSFNISSLYKTAHNEIKRKEKEIQELRRKQDNVIFRRRQPQSRSRRDSSYERNYKRYEENERTPSSRNKSGHELIESHNLQEELLNESVEKGNTRENAESKDISDVQVNKKVLMEISENPEKTLASVSLTTNEVQNLQKALQSVEISPDGGSNVSDVMENSVNKTKSNILAPKLNTPVTEYTRRMYKKHYGVSPEKSLPDQFSTVKEIKVEVKTEPTCSTSITDTVLVNKDEHNLSPQKPKAENCSQEENPSKDTNGLLQLSQNSEENIKSNVTRKNVKRISRVGKKIPENNICSSDFIKLGDRSISKKAIEQRTVTSSNKISKYSQLITSQSEKITRTFTKQESSSSALTLLINLKSSKNGNKDIEDCKVTPDETIESIINKAKSISPKERHDVKPKIITSQNILHSTSFGRINNKSRNRSTVINPITSYNQNNINKQVQNESTLIENKSPISKPNIIVENKVVIKAESEKLKCNSQKKSRQAQFLDSLFASPNKVEPKSKVNKNVPSQIHNTEKCQTSVVVNDKINTETKTFENNISPKESPKLSLDEDKNVSVEIQNKTPDIVANIHSDNQKTTLNSEVLSKLFEFQIPKTKSGNTNLITKLDIENKSPKIDNNPPALSDQNVSAFKKSPPHNSMCGFKSTENSCFSVSEDTIGMVTSLARVRTQISPIKTPDKKALLSVESGDENASSPKIMTRARLRDNEGKNGDNTPAKNHFSSVTTSSPLKKSPLHAVSTSEHCEFRRSKRVLAIVKKSVTETLSPTKSQSIKRKLHISDSSSCVVETKRQKVEEIDVKSENNVNNSNISTGSCKTLDPKLKNDFEASTPSNSKYRNDKDKAVVTENSTSKNDKGHFNRKSDGRKSPSDIKLINRNRLSNSKKLREEDERRKDKTRKYDERDISRSRRHRRRLDHNDKTRSRSISDDELKLDQRKRNLENRSTFLSKHKIFSSSHRSGFQRHSPSEFFNRKQRNSRKFLDNKFRRFGSPSPRLKRELSPITSRYMSTRKRERTVERSTKRKRNEDLRKEILNKEVNKALSPKHQIEQNFHTPSINSTNQDPNWKLTLISVENKTIEVTPSTSIEIGRNDPRMNITHFGSQSKCSSQEIKSNRILTDQTNQSNLIISPTSPKAMTTSSTPDKKPTRTTLIIKKSSRHNISFEDNTANTTSRESPISKTPPVESDNNPKEEPKQLNAVKDNSISDQNICALTTENLQKLNETLPGRCTDNNSLHSSNFPKKIVKTPLDFRQKYASVFSHISDSSEELDPFGNDSDSDKSRKSDHSWKP